MNVSPGTVDTVNDENLNGQDAVAARSPQGSPRPPLSTLQVSLYFFRNTPLNDQGAETFAVLGKGFVRVQRVFSNHKGTHPSVWA